MRRCLDHRRGPLGVHLDRYADGACVERILSDECSASGVLERITRGRYRLVDPEVDGTDPGKICRVDDEICTFEWGFFNPARHIFGLGIAPPMPHTA